MSEINELSINNIINDIEEIINDIEEFTFIDNIEDTEELDIINDAEEIEEINEIIINNDINNIEEIDEFVIINGDNIYFSFSAFVEIMQYQTKHLNFVQYHHLVLVLQWMECLTYITSYYRKLMPIPAKPPNMLPKSMF